MERSARFRFGPRVAVFSRRWRRALSEKLRTLDLADSTWPPLYHLLETGDGISQKELAQRIGLDDSSLVRPLEILEKSGLIVRSVADDDRRVRVCCLTEEGRAVASRFLHELLEVELEILAPLADDELAVFIDVIDKIEARLAHR